MIHYSQFVARRASPVPLLGAIASLAAIAIWLGDPQAGVGTAPAAGVPVAKGPAISAPERSNDELSLRVRNSSEPLPDASLPHDSGGLQPAAVALFDHDRVAAGLPP